MRNTDAWCSYPEDESCLPPRVLTRHKSLENTPQKEVKSYHDKLLKIKPLTDQLAVELGKRLQGIIDDYDDLAHERLLKYQSAFNKFLKAVETEKQLYQKQLDAAYHQLNILRQKYHQSLCHFMDSEGEVGIPSHTSILDSTSNMTSTASSTNRTSTTSSANITSTASIANMRSTTNPANLTSNAGITGTASVADMTSTGTSTTSNITSTGTSTTSNITSTTKIASIINTSNLKGTGTTNIASTANTSNLAGTTNIASPESTSTFVSTTSATPKSKRPSKSLTNGIQSESPTTGVGNTEETKNINQATTTKTEKLEMCDSPGFGLSGEGRTEEPLFHKEKEPCEEVKTQTRSEKLRQNDKINQEWQKLKFKKDMNEREAVVGSLRVHQAEKELSQVRKDFVCLSRAFVKLSRSHVNLENELLKFRAGAPGLAVLALKTGFLKTRSTGMTNVWKKRTCILTSQSLCIFRFPTDMEALHVLDLKKTNFKVMDEK
eukprot:TRINITY_DN4594_c0_g2_i3.p1 TRINITY_DN4594_c0_g2~~TRINITY_DN4594_c0_g2_i3.p1  ORF type:complete len:492 (-),score=88.08 TRINITY_DN4594_c0_g2_i3:2622-4097(-)